MILFNIFVEGTKFAVQRYDLSMISFFDERACNEKIFYYGLLELGVSIFIGVLTLYISYLIIDKLIRKKYEIEIENISYSIFCSGVLFSVAYLI